MAYQRVPNTAQVRLVFNSVGKEVGNWVHAEHSGAYNQAGLDALAAGVDQNAGPQFAAIMSSQDAYVRTEVRGLNSEYDLTSTRDLFATAGSVGTIPLSNNVSFAIAKLSGLTGRSAQGTFYCCALPRNVVSTGADAQDIMIEATAIAWEAVVDGLRIAIDNVGLWDPVIVSRYHNGLKRAEAITFPWIDTQYKTLTLATRRERLR